MRRREFIKVIAGSAVGWPVGSYAQQPKRIRRIGVLLGVSASDPEYQRRITAFRQRLRELGWADADIAFDLRFAEGNLDTLPALAAELVNAKVDIIITQGTEPAVAARKATSSIPIVLASVGDAVGAGLVSSLARPGGNVTGVTLVASEQGTKRLELTKEILPGLKRVAVIWNPNNVSHQLQFKELENAAVKLGLQVKSLPIRNAAELDATFDDAALFGAQTVVTLDDALIAFVRARILKNAMQHRWPVISEFRHMTAAGATMSYGPNLLDLWVRAGYYVDKIFKGATPAELPVEQPTKFELVINLKSVKALGLAVPKSLLVTADEVIE